MRKQCVQTPEVLLPAGHIDLTRWATVACDQYTSQPEYWDRVEQIVGESPSTYRMIYPEAFFLRQAEDRTAAIHQAMRRYLDNGVFAPPRRGFILTERTTRAGKRLGLMLCIDLEAYDFAPGATSLIRPTEGTILERIPPRVKIRKGAPLELPHVMLLADDPQRLLIEPLYAELQNDVPLYDFPLMMGGGHLRGWSVPDAEAVHAALEQLPSLLREDPILIAVGDGNHSLATARQCYLDAPGERTRYALVEVVNLYDDSLVFEPIHRLVQGVDAVAMRSAASRAGVMLNGGDVRQVQPFLDAWLPKDAQLDYIHGGRALDVLAAEEGNVGIRLAPIDKASLFPSLQGGQVLPRKAFSMGEAEEKRYYMECRAL